MGWKPTSGWHDNGGSTGQDAWESWSPGTQPQEGHTPRRASSKSFGWDSQKKWRRGPSGYYPSK
eukprot:6112597-Prorocentrum_lima.AAC.1